MYTEHINFPTIAHFPFNEIFGAQKKNKKKISKISQNFANSTVKILKNLKLFC